MRVQHLHVAAYLDKASSSPAEPSSASPPFPSSAVFPFVFRCLRPLAPKISLPDQPPRKKIAPGDVLGRVRNATKLLSCTVRNHTVQVPVGGATRWNPSAEQIKVLEALYRGGMRTPNAAQIERITEELGKHGRIEGKNVFYWFQNHKARERQKQKRAALLTLSTLDSPSLPVPATTTTKVLTTNEACDDVKSCKRRRTAWGDGKDDDPATVEVAVDCAGDDVTLELFPLRPQGKV